jgi:hypothetical protein
MFRPRRCAGHSPRPPFSYSHVVARHPPTERMLKGTPTAANRGSDRPFSLRPPNVQTTVCPSIVEGQRCARAVSQEDCVLKIRGD